MDDEQLRAAHWLTWFVAIGICTISMIAELSGLSSVPLLAPPLCAVVIGFGLPTKRFVMLAIIVGVAMLAPSLLAGPDERFLVARVVGLACLAIVISCRFHGWMSDRLRRDWVDAERVIPGVSMTAADTRVPGTVHRRQQDGNIDFSVSTEMESDEVTPAMTRLENDGTFDQRQLRLIETELRLMDGNNLGIAYAANLEPGVKIGRFIIVEPLGRGGEGNVYRGSDEGGEPAAIKILHNLGGNDRFRREMHVVRTLAHPNIVTAYEVGEFRRLPYIAMEWLRGPDLHALVRDTGPLDWLRATQYCLQTAEALSHAHDRDLLHRDIKPGNLILNGDDTVKVVDFGLAALRGKETSIDSVFRFETQKGHMAGTLPFMAPEQARSLANATVRSDIYALGATWFYLLTGKDRLRGTTFPHQFENLLVHRRFNALPEGCLPLALENIFNQMISYDAGDRVDDCKQLSLQIARALETVGESPVTQDINVLVVEDSRADMVFAIRMLRRANSTLNIHEAESLQAGIEIFKTSSIDLILLDLTLPDSSGVQTVRAFRRCAPNAPLVVLTGLTEKGIGDECLAAGADAFLSKNGLTPHRIERAVFVTLSRCGHALDHSSESLAGEGDEEDSGEDDDVKSTSVDVG